MTLEGIRQKISETTTKVHNFLLERRLTKAEIFRHPDYIPTENDRNYWANMADARTFMKHTFSNRELENLDTFKNWLSHLHKICIIGTKGDRHYRGVSAEKTGRQIVPGKFRTIEDGTMSGMNDETMEEIVWWHKYTDKGIDPTSKGIVKILTSTYIPETASPVFYKPDRAIHYPEEPEHIDMYLEQIRRTIVNIKDIEPSSQNEKAIITNLGRVI